MDRPPQLDDVEWLRSRYRVAGYRSIAKELGVEAQAVRRACVRYGLNEPGRRRGFTPKVATTSTAVPAIERVLARYKREQGLTAGPAPSIQLVVTRARDAVLAYQDGADDLIGEALEALASAALLALDQRQRAAVALAA